MELIFLGCFIFGAAFAFLSALLSMVGGLGHGGHIGHAAHMPHAPHVPHVGHAGHGAHALPHAAQQPAAQPSGAHAAAAHGGSHAGPVRALLPLLNASSLLAFLCWFGGAGYLLLHVAGWPLWAIFPVAILAGLVAAALIGWFLATLARGERVMDPRDYALVGAGGRVTVGIPAGGVGELVFSMGGARRSEAARSLHGQAIPRGTEVVIIAYAHGVADVLTLDELSNPRAPQALSQDGSRPAAGV